MKKKIITLFVASILALSVFGCGSENKTDDASKTTKTISESTEVGSKDVEPEQIQESTEEATTEKIEEFVFYIDGKEYILPHTLGEFKNMLENVATYAERSFFVNDENGGITYGEWGYIENTELFQVGFSDYVGLDDDSNVMSISISSKKVSIPGEIVEWKDDSFKAREESDAKYNEIKATLEGMGLDVIEENKEIDSRSYNILKAKVSDKEYYKISFGHRCSDEPYEEISISLIRDED